MSLVLSRWSILNWLRHHKRLHEHFRQFPDFFKVLPPTGPARSVKLLKLP
jgi:hypothetical protein